MIGVPGTAQRVFDALRRADVSVVMISQGSSEQSICCVVREAEARRAPSAPCATPSNRNSSAARSRRITLTPDISVLAAVGDGMAGTPGVAARLFGALARAQVNIRAIAQGASERNISVAIASRDAHPRAARRARQFLALAADDLDRRDRLGQGRRGAAWTTARGAFRACAAKPGSTCACAPWRTAGTCGWTNWARTPATGSSAAAQSRRDCDLDQFAAHVHTEHLPHAIIIDCSASDAVAAHYADWLAQRHPRGHAEQAGRRRSAGALPGRSAKPASTSGARFRYEATVGAGLPVIQTLRDLIDTGDKLQAVEGIFSGTLAWLFNRFDGSQPFSRLVLRSPGARLHRTGPARRPVRHRRRPQAGDPGARSGPAACRWTRWRWKAWCRRRWPA